MNTTDLDIYRSAKLLIDQHGEAAAIEAAMKADAMLDEGDLDGAAGELARGWADEPGDFLGFQGPDGPEIGVVLPETQPPSGRTTDSHSWRWPSMSRAWLVTQAALSG